MESLFTEHALAVQTVTTLVQAVTAVVTVVITLSVVKWASVQAKAQRDAAQATKDAIMGALRPVIVHAPSLGPAPAIEKDVAGTIFNHGPGIALDVVCRTWYGGQMIEGKLSTITAQDGAMKVIWTGSGGLGWSPEEHHGPLFEAIYRDVFGNQHRTVARFDNPRWVDFQFDSGGDAGNSTRFLIGTKYYRNPVGPDGKLHLPGFNQLPKTPWHRRWFRGFRKKISAGTSVKDQFPPVA